MSAFTSLDMIVIILMGLGAFFGFMRGFVHEAMSLATWVLVIFMLKVFHGPLANKIMDLADTNYAAASVVAFFAIIIVIGGGGRLAASKLGNGTRNSLLGPMDRVLGLGFGAIKGLLAATLIYLVANLGTDVIWGGAAARPEWIGKSKTYPLLQASSRAIIDFVEQRRGDAIKSDPKNTKSTEGRAKDDA
jgi:membrane protein required for colicin V production